MQDRKKITFGIASGFSPLVGADLFLKRVKSAFVNNDPHHFNVIVEEQQLPEEYSQRDSDHKPGERKLHIYDMIQQLVSRKADYIMLNCFISHTFIDELAEAINIPIINMMEGLKYCIQSKYPKVKKIGILTSDYVKKKKLFEKYFDAQDYELVYPDPNIQADCLMEAMYRSEGIKADHLSGKAIENLETACEHLVSRGADLIIPGFNQTSPVCDVLLRKKHFNLIDSSRVYADWAIQSYSQVSAIRQRRIGIIGGIGPLATVDLMEKIINNTPADKDQEHLKMIVEHNPQIPDRTAHLLEDKEDPIIPLYSCAKKLEQREADFIVIPCNTAHAFVDRIQRHLSIPIINMIEEVVKCIGDKYSRAGTIGLLATSGTIQTKIYHSAFEKTDIQLIIPDETHQEMVMQAIYGENGVKAGITRGEPEEKLLQAASFLVSQGARVLILGCTELPLLLAENEKYVIAGKEIVILDPTNILARKCVQLMLT